MYFSSYILRSLWYLIMACYQPLLAVDNGIDPETGKHSVKMLNMNKYLNFERARSVFGNSLMFLPCNKCVGCAADYARAWQCRIMCEYESRREKGEEKNVFLTLTYSIEPGSADLAVVRLRQFIKDVRNKYGNGIKFFAATERGDETHRLHHHLILFGVDFSDKEPIQKRGINYVYRSKELEKLWTFGFSSIGSLDISSAGYVSKYCDKKKISRMSDGESVIMSRGLGKDYFQAHYDEILISDYLYFDGNKFKMPRIFIRWALNSGDFYTKIRAESYTDRKRKVAQSFRYSKNRSFIHEEEAMKEEESIKVYKKSKQEVIRDVF